MKTTLPRIGMAALIATLLVPSSGWAIDIPHPITIVREARRAVHRAAGEVRGVVHSVASEPPRPSSRQRSGRPQGKAQKPQPRVIPSPQPGAQSAPLPIVTDPANHTSFAPAKSATTVTSVSPKRSGVRTKDRPITLKELPEQHSLSSKEETAAVPPPAPGDAPAIEPPEKPSAPPFARPVPGREGMVYPPNSPETPESMVDVRDFPKGMLVKNPRTGEIFRVP